MIRGTDGGRRFLVLAGRASFRSGPVDGVFARKGFLYLFFDDLRFVPNEARVVGVEDGFAEVAVVPVPLVFGHGRNVPYPKPRGICRNVAKRTLRNHITSTEITACVTGPIPVPRIVRSGDAIRLILLALLQSRGDMREQKSIGDILQRFPTANLTLAPTAIQRLERLSSHLGHNIYIKRDDLTGFCLGGNKVRKLDYLLADAKLTNADTLVTKRATSFSRNAAAAGKALGFDVHVFILGEESTQNQASQALFKRLAANLHFVSG